MSERAETLSEKTTAYEKQGYTLSFELTEDSLKCLETNKAYNPADFHIVAVHRFDGMTSTDDEAVIYVIEADEGNAKGLLIDAYGTYANGLSFEMIEKLKFARTP